MKRDDWAIKGLSEAIREVLGRDPMNGVEVGVWRGSLSKRILTEFPNTFLVMVDMYQCYSDEKLGGEEDKILDAAREALAVTQFAASRRMLMVVPSHFASMVFPRKAFDFVYIDGDHSEKAVASDIRDWYPTVRPGGFIGGHDYDGVGDHKGKFGVKKAVDAWAGMMGLEIKTTHQNIWYAAKPKENEG